RPATPVLRDRSGHAPAPEHPKPRAGPASRVLAPDLPDALRLPKRLPQPLAPLMRTSQLLIPTLREDPGEAETVSHRLMLRAGMIRKVAAGIYTYLPLGLRVIRKVEQIIREEMNRAGAQELLMPIASPAELWRETDRWNFYGKELLRFKDRHEREFCLGPTHEEVITDLFRREVRSYRQMPL